MKNPILLILAFVLISLSNSCTNPEENESIRPIDLKEGEVYFIYNEIIPTKFGLNGKDDYRVSTLNDEEYNPVRAEGFPFELTYHYPLVKVYDLYFQKDKQSDDIRVIDQDLEDIVFRLDIMDAESIHPIDNNRVVISTESEILIYDLESLDFESYNIGEYSILQLVQMDNNLMLLLQCEDRPCEIERKLARLDINSGDLIFSDIEVGYQMFNNDGKLLVSSIIQFDVDLLEIDPNSLEILNTISTDISQTMDRSKILKVNNLIYYQVDDKLYKADKDELEFELVETPEGSIERIIYSESREEFVMNIERRNNGLLIGKKMIFMNKSHEIVKEVAALSRLVSMQVFEK